jgi:hypothetical protein
MRYTGSTGIPPTHRELSLEFGGAHDLGAHKGVGALIPDTPAAGRTIEQQPKLKSLPEVS